MPATITKLPTAGKVPTIPKRTTNRIKKQWDALQGRGNRLDFDRAKLLHEIWNRLQKNDKNLAHFMVNVLEEYAGKRCVAFVRLAHAFDAVDDVEVWAKIGGKAVVILSHCGKVDRRRIMRKVDATLKRTGRTTLSQATFRSRCQEVLGEEKYRKALSERQSRSRLSLELAVLKQFILTLIGKNPDLKKGMSREVRRALGLDLVGRKTG